MTDTTPLRVGVVGTGAVAQLIHLPLLTERRDVEVVALADPDELRVDTIARRYDIPKVDSVEELLGGFEVDAVVLCTPNHLHAEMAVAVLEAGRHVLVERPLATDVAGARRIVDAAEAAGRVALPGMSHRFRPDVAALKAFVSSGRLGRIYAARAAWMNRAVPMRRIGWRQRIDSAGGGALMDLGTQAIDLLLWVLGQPRVTRVTAMASRADLEVEDAATVVMETEDGAALTVEVSWNFFSSEDRHYARVLGTEGGGELPPLEICTQAGGRPMDVTPRGGELPKDGRDRYRKAYRREHDHFFRMVRGHAPIESAEDQIHVMEIVEAAYRSIEDRCEVRL